MSHRSKLYSFISLVGLIGMTSAACVEEFPPRSNIDGLRILALVADKFEVSVTDPKPVQIEPFVVATSTKTLTHEWRFCPISAGGRAGFACAIASCEIDIPSTPSGKIIFHPGQAALACIQSLSDNASAQEQEIFESADNIPDNVETVFRYTVTDENGESAEAIFRLPLWIMNTPSELNQAISIETIKVGGMTVTSTPAEIVLNSLEEIPLEVQLDPNTIEEQDDPIIAFFSTQGRFSSELALGSDIDSILRVEQLAVSDLDLYIVARDLRGSQDVLGPISIKRSP